MGTPAGIDDLRAQLDAAPNDLRRARRYWKALGDFRGADIRSGRYAVEAFGRAALYSDDAGFALAEAYKNVFELSGEGPMKRYFNDDLMAALRRARANMSGDRFALVDWLISSLEEGAYDI